MAGEAARRSDPKLSAVPTKRLYPSCKHPFRSSEVWDAVRAVFLGFVNANAGLENAFWL